MAGIGQRKQVQLVQIAVAQGVSGRNTETEGQKFGVWADIINPSGFREYENGKTTLGQTKLFKIRFRFDRFPDADWKIRYDNSDWTISKLLKQDEKRFYWLITATRRV